MLVGAPLVARELEHGTHRLVWTQSISAGRWLAIKLAVLFAVTLAATEAMTALMTWWHANAWSQLDGHINPLMYDFEGIVPLAYCAFALALGIAAGVLIRRTVPRWRWRWSDSWRCGCLWSFCCARVFSRR